MGGSSSVARSQAGAKLTGSAVKYEDKNVQNGDNGSKPGADEKPLPVEDAKTIATDIAEPKETANSIPPLRSSGQMNESSEHLPPALSAATSTLPNGEELDKFPGPDEPLVRNDYSASQIALFTVGDFVRVKQEDGSYMEGLLMEVLNEERVIVDFGGDNMVRQCAASECELVVPSDAYEEGDQVQVQPQGSAMYFVGRISKINPNGTYDVVMEGDDPDDIEYGVPESNMRKLMSRRALVVARWKRAALVVSSIHNFQSFALDANQFNASTRGNRPSIVASMKANLANLATHSQDSAEP